MALGHLLQSSGNTDSMKMQIWNLIGYYLVYTIGFACHMFNHNSTEDFSSSCSCKECRKASHWNLCPHFSAFLFIKWTKHLQWPFFLFAFAFFIYLFWTLMLRAVVYPPNILHGFLLDLAVQCEDMKIFFK